MSTTPTLPQAALAGIAFDRAAADAHIMEPPQLAGIRSSRGREEGVVNPTVNPPAGGPLGFNTDGFVAALNTALAAHTAGYAMELREHGLVIASNQAGGALLGSDGSEPWADNIRMHIASCSKLITAMAMTRTLAAHNLPPDRAIFDFLPTYWQKGQNIDKINFHNLMTHTSGFNVVTSNSTYPWMKSQVAAGVTMAAYGQYAYENMNFGLCRILIPVINGNIPAGYNFPPASQDSRGPEYLRAFWSLRSHAGPPLSGRSGIHLPPRPGLELRRPANLLRRSRLAHDRRRAPQRHGNLPPRRHHHEPLRRPGHAR
jgi:hypothetical protein